jgi:FkbM family methyltransferase
VRQATIDDGQRREGSPSQARADHRRRQLLHARASRAVVAELSSGTVAPAKGWVHDGGVDWVRRGIYRVFAGTVRLLFGSRAARWVWRIPGSRRMYDRLAAMRPEVVTVDGHTIRLDATDSLLLGVNGTYEAAELDLFARSIRSGDTVLDIGAHIGLYTLTAARAVGPTGRVVAFEPSTANFVLLEANVVANGYSNVELHRAACSDTAGTGVLVLSPTNSGDHQLRADGAGSRVDTVRLDDLDVRPQVVKMDVQGAEPLVLAGAAQLLASDDLIVFTEVSVDHLAHDGAAAYVESLRAAGLTLLRIDEADGTTSPYAGLPDTGFVNLLCVKGAEATLRVTRDASASTP